MTKLHEEIADFISNRTEAVYSDLLQTESFNEVSREITGLRSKLESSIPTENVELLNLYSEEVHRRTAHYMDAVYSQAFKDGFKVAQLLLMESESNPEQQYPLT